MENSKALYETVWDILVDHAGASKNPRDKAAFVLACLDRDNKLYEYRFCGRLGFGGKLWRYDGRIYITCYPEDSTPERDRILRETNTQLAKLLPTDGVYGPP